jgi:hypothetical protein
MAMDIINFFKESATQADTQLRGLAVAQLDNLERRRLIGQIQDRFEQMAADGVLDQGEMQELSARFKAAGLDDSQLMLLYEQLKGADSSVRGDDASKLKDLIGGQLSDASTAASDDQAMLNFKVQLATDEFTNGVDAASRLSKLEHDTYMNVIRHLVA